eukprot:Sdes_comp18772_c0_seq3m9169
MFIQVTNSTTSPPSNTSLVSEIRFSVTSFFATSLYESCQDVYMPQNNQKVMTFMCLVSDPPCDPYKWLNFLGTKSDMGSPFQINFNYVNSTSLLYPFHTDHISPLNSTNLRCNDSGPDSCSCSDCASACPSFPHPSPSSDVIFPT